jgi:hypothetical protein
VPPEFAIDGAVRQMTVLRAPADRSTLVASLVDRAAAKGIPGDWRARAGAVYAQRVVPALDRQIALLRSLRPKAVHDAGVWRLPDGDAYYVAALKAAITTDLTPAEVHRLGLDVTRELTARADVLFTRLGMSKGSVAERYGALFRDPTYLYPNTDAGKAKEIADLNALVVEAPALVIATGGPSIPKMGATGFAYDLARRFRLKVVEPRPALVPLTLGGEEVLFRELSGVSAPVAVRAGRAAFHEAALFTHRGLSGPAILQASSYWRHGEPIAIDFLPDQAPGWLAQAKRESPRANLPRLLGRHLPERLATTLADRLNLAGELGRMADAKLRAAEERLSTWTFNPNGTEGFAKAEVTAGGISTADLSSQTMEARRVPGLYAIGEAVDVTGWLGGYNFQWAWASGWAAAQAL